MKFQGDIASIPIADVAQNLAANRKSGVLTIRAGSHERYIVFRDGKIVSYSDNGGFSIPEWLEERQIISPDAFQKAMRRYRRTRRKGLGLIFEESGDLPHEDYVHHVRGLVHDMLCETLSYRQGTFEFRESAQNAESLNREILDAGIEVPVNEVLMEAARRMDEWESIRKSLPAENDIYQVGAAEKEYLVKQHANDDAMVAAIELLDGTRSIREVVRRIPTGRFEAARAVAQLVSKNRARPVDGTELVAQIDQDRSPEQRSRALVRLKAAYEREPGNRVVLEKLAELSEHDGRGEEAAVYRKLFAQLLRDGGDVAAAERELRRSLELSPRDTTTWQRLYEILEQKGHTDEILDFGTRLAANLRQLGFEELARDHLARMLERFPTIVALRFEYADTLFALGDRPGAVEHLLQLAREQLHRGKDDDAERTLAKVIEYDSHHRQAREIFDKLKSGAVERQRQRRRTVLRAAAAGTLLAVLCLYVGYDLYVRREFAFAMRQVFAEGLIEKGEYRKAQELFDAICRRHPFSLVSFLEVQQCAAGMAERNRSQENRRKGAAPPSRATPDPKVFPAPESGKH